MSSGKKQQKAKKSKVGFLLTHPIQYFSPLFEKLNQYDEIDSKVLYRTRAGVDAYYDHLFNVNVKWDVNLTANYSFEFLSKKTKIQGIELGIIPALIRNRFDVLVVHGYNSPTNILALAVAKLVGTKVLLRGDSQWSSKYERQPVLIRLVKRLLLSCFDGAIAIGTRNTQYYEKHKINKERIYFAPLSVDNALFSQPRETAKTARAKFRCRYSIPPTSIVVLYVGKFVEQKRVADLISAMAHTKDQSADFWLVLSGSGPLESELRRLAEKLGLRNVIFTGFMNQTQLPEVYAGADIFSIAAENESWGLVLNEAMAAGLPVIASDQVGAAADLVNGKDTGIIFTCGNIFELALAIERLTNGSLRKRMGDKAQMVIRDWSLEQSAQRIAEIVLRYR